MNTPSFPQVSVAFVAVVIVSVFAVAGIDTLLIRPKKAWYRLATLAALGVLASLPALTGWTALR